MDVVSANIDPITYMEWGRHKVVLICVVCYSVLGFLHMVMEEFVVLIKVDGEVASM